MLPYLLSYLLPFFGRFEQMAHTRRVNVIVSSDDTREWKRHMEEHHQRGLEAFYSARSVIRTRAVRLCQVAAKQLAAAYKSGDPFPAHFVWAGGNYELQEPEVLKEATKKQRKSKDFLEGILSALVSDHEWDRFSTLIIGLTTAQKIVTHWSEILEDDQ
jgi:hypothetical protein